MKIKVPAIPEEGLSLDFDQATPWFHEVLCARFAPTYPPDKPASGHVDLFKTMQNVSLSGDLALTLVPTCANCGSVFETRLEVPLQRILAPYFSDPRVSLLSEEEEIELSAEDLEFSFYHNDQINLAEIVGEEIELALPIRFLCKEDCLGLCPRCGINRNEATCQCQETVEGSPFSTLRNFKLKS